jgi:predicted Zn-dependent protease
MIKLLDILNEIATNPKNYDEFKDIEQEMFLKGISYDEYKKGIEVILPKNDKGSLWLYNHHAAELAWEAGKEAEAKKHIANAMKNNPFGNSITNVLDFIINKKGTKSQLKQAMSQIKDKIEKDTATKLLNDPKYGGKLED